MVGRRAEVVIRTGRRKDKLCTVNDIAPVVVRLPIIVDHSIKYVVLRPSH